MVEQLNNLQNQVGLPQEYAKKIIKSITTTKMAAAIETTVTQGRLNMKQIRELKEANVDLDNMIFKDAIASGVDGYDVDVKKSVRKAAHGLRLTRETAMSIASKVMSIHLSGNLILLHEDLKRLKFWYDAFMTLQLGGILGLSGKEITEVHRSLADQAFRQQAEVILADGQLTKARVEQLNNLQKQVGLHQEYAQKIIKSMTTTKMAAAMETTVTQGRLNMKQIRELKEANVDLEFKAPVHRGKKLGLF
ncbi:hypothetical protein SESBI_24183 [Sesbania bispinosa]|nr:hypothetical protein SESBI_24183 [Sesbania bispinosa]